MQKFALIVALILLTTSCVAERLYVQNQYINHENLASYHVGTPDPRKKDPDIGQRLVIFWAVPGSYLKTKNPHIILKMRYRNRQENQIIRPLKESRGHFVYELFNEEFREKGGLLTYKTMIIGDDKMLDEWRHQIWTDLLVLEEAS